MTTATETARILPLPTPEARTERLIVYAMRRIAANGLDDAHAANAMLGSFGLSYRRPLVLMRAYLAEIARASTRQITIAPCCCPRMTHDEARLLAVVAVANANPPCARHHLSALTGGENALPALSAAMALNDALADLGHPVSA